MATPTLALIPTGYKAGKLYSVLPESGVGDFDVVRATEATRVNEDGLIETMGANVPRLDYSGGGCPVLLTEGQSTNLIPYSEDFTQWSAINASVNSNQAISPDGTLNADKLIPSNTSGNIFMNHQVTFNASDYTLSFFIKYNGRQYVQLLFGSNVSSEYSNFDLINQTITYGNGNIENYGNDWYKISLTASVNAATSEVYLWSIDSPLSSRASSSTGNGVDGYYIYGAQTEQGSFPTSLINTNGSVVTRNADQVNGAGDAATFNDSEGVLMAEISALVESSPARAISIGEGLNYENGIIMSFDTSDNLIKYKVRSNNITTVDLSTPNVNRTSNHKICLKYKVNDFELWIDGFKANYVLSGAVPLSLSKLQFSDMNVTGAPFYGKTKQVQYFDSALTDSELETLTSWASFSEMANAQNYTIQ